ncbi:MAG: thiamine diphosphokinase [Eubacteriales bacterium]|nr:thiamine diphosphokinase [Eubacteriales bacterium]
MTVLLLASAPENEYGYVKRLAEQADFLVCADGGLRHAAACGLQPELVIGDFDSGTVPDGCEVIRLRPEKDDSDLMCCVKEVIRRGAEEIWIACASGGRIDHFLANLLLLEYLDRQGIRAAFYDSRNRVRLHPGGERRYGTDAEYKYIGLIPLDAELRGVTLRGLKYPLTHAVLDRAAPISISNEAMGKQYTIRIDEGRALLIESRD